MIVPHNQSPGCDCTIVESGVNSHCSFSQNKEGYMITWKAKVLKIRNRSKQRALLKFVSKLQRKPKEQSKMDNPETPATLRTRYTARRQTKHKTKN